MAPPHHLLAAAFGLCGILFLLHIDSVNSLRCRECLYRDADCDSGEATDVECDSSAVCGTLVMYYFDGLIKVFGRGCSDGGGFKCLSNSTFSEERIYLCDTDNCNSKDNSSFSQEDKTGILCSLGKSSLEDELEVEPSSESRE